MEAALSVHFRFISNRLLMIKENKLNKEQYCENIEDRMNMLTFTPKQLEHRIENKANTDACCNAVSQWHQNNDQERREGLFEITPVHFANDTDHEEPDYNQGRRCDCRNAGYNTHNRAEKQSQCEQYTYSHRSQSCSSSSCNPCTGLYIGRGRTCPEHGPRRCTHSICQQRTAGTRELSVFEQSGLFCNAQHRSGRIK